MVEFKEYGQKVELKFGNARTAQVWRVPADQAQLKGSCRMEFTGAVMRFERAEFAPRAHTFKILRSSVSADG